MYMQIQKQIQNTKVCTSLGTNLRAAPLRFALFVLSKHIPRLRWTDYDDYAVDDVDDDHDDYDNHDTK